ncbi:MAG TPA: sodium-dependent transporter [Bacteroidales bacterium]|nr:sodium-dependent transporter [Bacteroidales bacterium]HPF02307.1 sodium-dependent transporter [Bacteroidales bacterium]HPR12225.1 sodium-dependent transporter [Bacteroidales bacterium]HRW85841.1 sodium-dependent transporter [Bacteroidales bacterium]
MSKTIDSSADQRFTSRIGLIMSALGIAVGTGNIWRFPRIAAQSGGDTGAGAFLIAWLIFLVLWSIPLIIAEYASGRKHRSSVIGTFLKSMGPRFTWIGSFVAFVPLAITFFYSVVVGWCIYYFIYMATHSLPDNFESAMLVWNNYQAGVWPVVTHIAAVFIGALVIWKGIKSIEKVNKFLIPSLLFIVVICVIRAITLPGAGEGLAYLFRPDLSQLGNPKTWLDALTQNAWDTGAGWGLFLTYAAYMKKEHGAVSNAFLTGIGNNTVSLLAGIMIFGTVFAVLKHEMGMNDVQVLEIMKSSGPASTGLTFIWMPQLFNKMFGGGMLSILFFLGLTFAGFSSLIAMLELPARVMVDTGMKRNRAILLIVVIVILCGIPSARSLNFLSNQDFVWGVGLMISGALIAAMIIKQGPEQIRAELNLSVDDRKLGKWWHYIIKWFIPAAAGVLLIWWLAQSFVPGEWFNPFSQFSFMTCIFQWSVVLAILIIFNRRITRLFI